LRQDELVGLSVLAIGTYFLVQVGILLKAKPKTLAEGVLHKTLLIRYLVLGTITFFFGIFFLF
jgi:hypothetical protein